MAAALWSRWTQLPAASQDALNLTRSPLTHSPGPAPGFVSVGSNGLMMVPNGALGERTVEAGFVGVPYYVKYGIL